jgi:hypothetical protein
MMGYGLKSRSTFWHLAFSNFTLISQPQDSAWSAGAAGLSAGGGQV